MNSLSKSGFVYIILLCVVVFILGIVLYVFIFRPPITSQPSDTSITQNWNVYKNEKFGFELKYPQNWKIDERITDVKENTYRNAAIPIVVIQKDKQTYVDLEFQDGVADKTTLENYVNNSKSQFWKTTLNGIPGYLHTFVVYSENNTAVTNFIFLSNKKMLTFTWSVPASEMATLMANTEVLDILRSFKLTGEKEEDVLYPPLSGVTVNTNTWQKYVDADIGIEMKVPTLEAITKTGSLDGISKSKSGGTLIKKGTILNPNGLPICSDDYDADVLCLIPGVNQIQPENIEKIVLSGKLVQNFYVWEKTGNTIFRVVQAEDNSFSIASPIDGAGLAETFNTVLQSIKFRKVTS